MDQVFCYDVLLKEKIEACKTKDGQRLYSGPIKLFYEGIQGIDQIFDNYSKRRGLVGRIYGFCSDFCYSLENQKKLMEASRNIAHAAALLNLTATTSVETQQRETKQEISKMMERVEQLIDQQAKLKVSLDQALAQSQNESEQDIARKVANILQLPESQILKSIL